MDAPPTYRVSFVTHETSENVRALRMCRLPFSLRLFLILLLLHPMSLAYSGSLLSFVPAARNRVTTREEHEYECGPQMNRTGPSAHQFGATTVNRSLYTRSPYPFLFVARIRAKKSFSVTARARTSPT